MGKRLLSPYLCACYWPPTTPFAQEAKDADVFNVSIVGKGEVFEKPDIARVQGSLVRQEDENSQVMEDVNLGMTRAIKALKKSGIDAKNINAGRLSIRILWSHHWTFSGYEGRRPFVVTVRKVEECPNIIDVLFKAGVNSLDNVIFDFRDR